MSATALPLKTGPHYKFDILDANGARFAEALPSFTETGAARATLIVRAVNAHDDLLAALKALHEAATDAYKAGRVDALSFVTAGNVIAKAEAK